MNAERRASVSVRGFTTLLFATVLAWFVPFKATRAVAQSSGADNPLFRGQQVRVLPLRPLPPLAPAEGSTEAAPAGFSTIFPGPAGANLTYYGGPVVSNADIFVVKWGTGSYLPEVDTVLPSFYTAIVNGSYMDFLSEYSTSGLGGDQFIQHGNYLGLRTDTAVPSKSLVDDSDIQTELVNLIRAGVVPAPARDGNGHANTMYMVYFPAGKTINIGGDQSCAQFCAYHSTFRFTFSGVTEDVLYGVFPDMQAGSQCTLGCGTGTPLQNYTVVASHEVAETITDAEVGLATVVGPPLAWYDNNNGEIADICADYSGLADGYTVSGLWSNLQKGCVTGPATFAVSAPASAQNGSAFDVTVTAKRSDGTPLGSTYTGQLHFSSTDINGLLPPDYNFTPGDNGSHTFSVTLGTDGPQNINVRDSRATGITGTAGVDVVSAQTVQVNVGTSPNGLNFSVDGTNYSSAQTLTWDVGSTHTIGTVSTQAGGPGTQFVFNTWSDSGALSHDVTAPASSATYTANFGAQYQLTTVASPAAGGSVSPPSGLFYAANSVVNVLAVPNSGYTFIGWNGPVTSTGNSSTSVMMAAPTTVTANFGTTSVPGQAFVLTTAQLMRTGSGDFQAAVTVKNSGTGTAQNVQLLTATLNGTNGTPVPQNLGNIAPGATATTVVTFPAAAGATGTAVVERYSGSYLGRNFTSSLRVVLP